MAVYVDGLRDWGWRLGISCHMAVDTLEELHTFAQWIGMKRKWFQPGDGRPHYDLTEVRRNIAVRIGALEVSSRVIIAVMKRTK